MKLENVCKKREGYYVNLADEKQAKAFLKRLIKQYPMTARTMFLEHEIELRGGKIQWSVEK